MSLESCEEGNHWHVSCLCHGSAIPPAFTASNQSSLTKLLTSCSNFLLLTTLFWFVLKELCISPYFVLFSLDYILQAFLRQGLLLSLVISVLVSLWYKIQLWYNHSWFLVWGTGIDSWISNALSFPEDTLSRNFVALHNIIFIHHPPSPISETNQSKFNFLINTQLLQISCRESPEADILYLVLNTIMIAKPTE